MAIEPIIVKIAASRITLRELAEIEDNIVYCEEKLAIAQSDIPLKDYYEIGQKNVDYHRLIAQATIIRSSHSRKIMLWILSPI